MPIDCIQIPQGTVLAGYRIESELGRGNNAVVYLAEQQALGRKVALKILLPELAAEPGYVESFLREARLAARLDHPYIVQAYEAGATPESYYYFAMELVIGPSLEEIRRNTPEELTFELMFRVSVELAEALDYAWSVHKMTHGDIKPGNLLISEETGCLKLADLGLARVSGGKVSDEIMATPLYAAPEIIRGEHAEGVRSDLYSFGIMLYELLCGAPPFVGSPQKVLQQHLYSMPQPLARRNPDLDPVLIAFVERLIEKEPEKRPADWAEVRAFFLDRLERLRNRTAPVSGAQIPLPPGPRSRHYVRAAIALVILLVFLAGLGLVVLFAIRLASFDPESLPLSESRGATLRPAAPPVREPDPDPELTVRLSSPAAVAPPDRPAVPPPSGRR